MSVDSRDSPPHVAARRWTILAVISIAQLMVVLDGSVVNIALPQAQADLGISDVMRQWVVTAYGLAFGGLLLGGGRIADRWGRRRALLTGLIGFAVASAVGGLAVDGGMLIGARAAQGVFAALLVNVVIAVVAVAITLVPRHEPGVILATGGIAALVYAFSNAELFGWTLRVVTHRNRAGAYLATGFAIMAMFGQFLLLTCYFQPMLGYPPIRAGLAFIPLTGGLVMGSTQIGARLVARMGTRWVMAAGYTVAATGFLTFTFLCVDSSYWAVLSGSILLGLGTGTANVAATAPGTSGVGSGDAGVAAAMVNTSQQLGWAIGTAMLATIAASVTTSIAAAGSSSASGSALASATMQGFIVAFWVAAGLMTTAATLTLLLVNASRGPADAPATAVQDRSQVTYVPTPTGRNLP